MTVTVENGALKVLLSEAETVSYRIDCLLFGGDVKASKSALANLYKAAIQKAPLRFDTNRLMIEIYPVFAGGCEVVFTPDKSRTSVTVKQRRPIRMITECNTVDGMIETVGCIYKSGFMPFESRLYHKNGIYRLITLINQDCKPLLSLIKRLGDRCLCGGTQAAATYEHWHLVCENDAVLRLGKAFFKVP